MFGLILAAAFVSTLLGGLFALRFRDKLHLILGFSAGAVIAVAFFDLLPEALELAGEKYEVGTVTAVIALGFLLYIIIHRLIFPHSHGGDHGHDEHEQRPFAWSDLNVAGLLGHSFLDGVAIGLAFQASSALGLVVAIAVLAHDFLDGVNVVGLLLRNNAAKSKIYGWLLVASLAPTLGMASTTFFSLPSSTLGLILALFCGFFFYIGASDLLPESHHSHPTRYTTLSTIFGMVVMYAVIAVV